MTRDLEMSRLLDAEMAAVDHLNRLAEEQAAEEGIDPQSAPVAATPQLLAAQKAHAKAAEEREAYQKAKFGLGGAPGKGCS